MWGKKLRNRINDHTMGRTGEDLERKLRLETETLSTRTEWVKLYWDRLLSRNTSKSWLLWWNVILTLFRYNCSHVNEKWWWLCVRRVSEQQKIGTTGILRELINRFSSRYSSFLSRPNWSTTAASDWLCCRLISSYWRCSARTREIRQRCHMVWQCECWIFVANVDISMLIECHDNGTILFKIQFHFMELFHSQKFSTLVNLKQKLLQRRIAESIGERGRVKLHTQYRIKDENQLHYWIEMESSTDNDDHRHLHNELEWEICTIF